MVQSGGQGSGVTGGPACPLGCGHSQPLDTGAPGPPEVVSGRGRSAAAPWMLRRLWVESGAECVCLLISVSLSIAITKDEFLLLPCCVGTQCLIASGGYSRTRIHFFFH